jgi:pre-mRNA-processing factor 39
MLTLSDEIRLLSSFIIYYSCTSCTYFFSLHGSLFERALSLVERDYLCYHLWDRYIEFESSQKQLNQLATIYINTLKFPTKKLHMYYEIH